LAVAWRGQDLKPRRGADEGQGHAVPVAHPLELLVVCGQCVGDGNPKQPGAYEHEFSIWSKWARACKPAPNRLVPLSARGLSGGAASYFGDRYACPAPRRAYIRVRAIFRTPMSLRLDRRLMLKTDVPVRQASFVVRTESGKPFAYASVNEAGKARLFTSPACVAE
jgi:hypothetical protein